MKFRFRNPSRLSSRLAILACAVPVLGLQASCSPDPEQNTAAGGAGGQGGTAIPSAGPFEGWGLGGASLLELDEAECDFFIEHELSEAIGTVATVHWSTDLPYLRYAAIQFGHEKRVFSAPVDLRERDDEGRFTTVLVGMSSETDVDFRIIAGNDERRCVSPQQSYRTGPGPNGSFLPTSIETKKPDEVAPGFLVTAQFLTGAREEGEPSGPVVYILDHEGELVWWHRSALKNITKAVLSFDSRYIFVRNLNVGAESTQGAVERISIDGLSSEVFSVPRSHHDMAALPGGKLALIVKEEGEPSCDEVVAWEPGGSTELIYRVRDAYPSGVEPAPGGEECHCNSIHYNPSNETFTLSDLNTDSFLHFGKDGKLIWILGGRDSMFDGPTWDRQHGHHLVDEDHLFFFNNNAVGQPAFAQYITLDRSQMTASAWTYEGTGLSSATLGDAQRLSNGNFLITYSNQGVVLEIDDTGESVQQFSFRAGAAIGYVDHRPSLYGPPAR